jgi:hypothetical protein
VHDIAFITSALRQNARLQSGHFDGDLVGVELDEGVAGRNCVAFLLVPFGHGRFNDRLAERRDFYGEHSDDPKRIEIKVGILKVAVGTNSPEQHFPRSIREFFLAVRPYCAVIQCSD